MAKYHLLTQNVGDEWGSEQGCQFKEKVFLLKGFFQSSVNTSLLFGIICAWKYSKYSGQWCQFFLEIFHVFSSVLWFFLQRDYHNYFKQRTFDSFSATITHRSTKHFANYSKRRFWKMYCVAFTCRNSTVYNQWSAFLTMSFNSNVWFTNCYVCLL